MDVHEPADDRTALERELAGRPRPEPTEALRRRVMDAVHGALGAGPSPVRRAMSAWEFAATIAAAVVLWMNLSMSAVNRMDWEADGRLRNGIETAVALVRDLAPELSEAEARRQVLLLKAAERMVRAPKPEPPARPRSRWTLPDLGP